jgi:hypothetical protein
VARFFSARGNGDSRLSFGSDSFDPFDRGISIDLRALRPEDSHFASQRAIEHFKSENIRVPEKGEEKK